MTIVKTNTQNSDKTVLTGTDVTSLITEANEAREIINSHLNDLLSRDVEIDAKKACRDSINDVICSFPASFLIALSNRQEWEQYFINRVLSNSVQLANSIIESVQKQTDTTQIPIKVTGFSWKSLTLQGGIQ